MIFADNNNLSAPLGLAKLYEKMGKDDLARKEYFLLSESEITYFQKLGLDGLRRVRE